MKANIGEEQKIYSQKIYNLRQSGRINEAITVCNEAIKKFGDSNFYYKIHGDLLFENKEFDKALDSYLLFLDRIKNKPEYFTNFSRFFSRLSRVKLISKDVFDHLVKIVDDEQYAYVLRKSIVNLVLDTFVVSEELEQAIARGKGKTDIQVIKDDYKMICDHGKSSEIIYLCRVSEKECIRSENNVNRYVLKRLENNRLYEQAISWTKKILEYSEDGVVIRTLFRLCRECSDYEAAEEYLIRKNIEYIEEFNVQYELVYYFDYIGDEKKRNTALNYIRKLAVNSLPGKGNFKWLQYKI